MRHFLKCGLLWVGLGGVFALGQGTAPAPQVTIPQTTTIVEPPAPLLNEHFNGLPEVAGAHGAAADAGAATIDGKDCSPFLAAGQPGGDGGNCVALLKEDGLRRFDSGTYHHPSGSQTFTVFAMEFNDATDALSAYTFFRSQMRGARVSGAEARLGKSANEMSTDAASYLVWSGTAVMRVTGHVSTEELIGLTSGLPKASGRRGLAPLLPTILPAGLDASSLQYAVGPAGYRAMNGTLPVEVLGWDKSVEVATANYAGKPGKGTLTLLMYPTPQIAGDRLRAIQKAMDDAGIQGFGTVVLRRVGPLVGVTTGGWTEAQAKALPGRAAPERRGDVRPEDAAGVPCGDPEDGVAAREYCGVQRGFDRCGDNLLGLFLGLGRAWLRKLQGKPAYVEPEFLSISLRESETQHFEKIHSEQGEGKG